MYLYLFTRRIVISSIGEWGRKWVEGEWAHAILTFTHAKYTLANVLTFTHAKHTLANILTFTHAKYTLANIFTFTHAKYTLANVLTHAGYTMLLHTC